MLKNQIKYSFRAFRKQKSYVFINVLGLAIGMACTLIILLFVNYELSFDQYNEKKDRLYRVILNGKISGQEVTVTSTASIIGPTMLNEFPEVENFLRINSWGETVISREENHFTERAFFEADSSFFDFFSIPLIRGKKETVLNEPHTLVLSESSAKKIFGDEDPIDKMLKVGNDSIFYRVTGVFKDVPDNTHFRANAIGSFTTNSRSKDPTWLSNSFSTYVLLHPNANPADANARFAPMIEKYVGPEVIKYFGITLADFLEQGNKYNMYLQKLTDIHLDPSIDQELRAAHDPKYLWIFGSIAVLIIVIASINFMNLSTAQASKRAKEVGIKKVSGSSRNSLLSQFLIETIILSFFALVLSALIAELALPYFNKLLNVQLSVGYFDYWYITPMMILSAGIIGALAGSYPAFYLSSFSPYMVLKGMKVSNTRNGKLKNVLVVLQFSISIVLIVGTLIMFRQIQFMLNKDLGFNKDHVLVLRRGSTIGNKIKSFKEEIRLIPEVINITASTAVPGHNNNNNGYRIKGRPEESYLAQTNWVDYDYFDTYDIQLSSGRFFDKSFTTDDEADAIIVNQVAVRNFLLEDPFSIRFVNLDEETEEISYSPIVGVVKDFHHESLKSTISPYILRCNGESFRWGYISIKLSENANSETLEKVEEVWGSFTNNSPMQYFFMDKDIERLYSEEKRNAELAILFTILGIFIASIGLYGLTSFTVQQRTKEIGVRKTFGASVYKIWLLVAKDILILVVISTVVAWPLIYWVAENWLQNYQYRINLRVTDFLISLVVALGIALATISYRTIRTALVNPSDSLRYE
jgi:putative ABC transport system permease protein